MYVSLEILFHLPFSYPYFIFSEKSIKCYLNIDVYFECNNISTLCISYIKVLILLQDSLKIKLQNIL